MLKDTLLSPVTSELELANIVKSQQIILEMGHVYLSPEYLNRDVIVTEEEYKGIEIGLAVLDMLSQEGVLVQSMLFVDDLHGFSDAQGFAENNELEQRLNETLAYFTEKGFTPDILVSEAEMTSGAWYLYSLLKKQGSVVNGSRKLSETYNGAVLKNGTKLEERPSCSLIDAALYLKKVGTDNTIQAITVLHEKYKSQQDEVKKILTAYGLSKPNVTVVYYDDEGNIALVDDWTVNL